LQHIRWQFCR